MNPSLFSTHSQPPQATATNEAGGKAYAVDPRHALAQYVVTGCLNGTYYASAETQLNEIVRLSGQVTPDYLAKLAVYARQFGHMKDTPAILTALLVQRDVALFRRVFPRTIDNPKMLRNFVQVMRSGAVGRKSLGTAAKKAIQQWFGSRTESQLFRGVVGEPSLADIIRLAHPKPAHAPREAFYRYLLGYEGEKAPNLLLLPPEVEAFERFKKDRAGEIPRVPFQLISGLDLSTEQWITVAHSMSWTELRMNLNTLARHGVFKSTEAVAYVAQRIADKEEIKRAKVFPFQLFSAFLATQGNQDVPKQITNALQDAAQAAVENVPQLEGSVIVGVDVSGSMSSPITGHRRGATTAVRCVDAAAVLAAALIQRNNDSAVIPFDTRHHDARDINPRDSIMTNAQKLSHYGGGGTDCSIPIQVCLDKNIKADTIIIVSDNESWAQMGASYRYYRFSTTLASAWHTYSRRFPASRLVCLDIQPSGTVQASDSQRVLNIGGFSDAVFPVLAEFASGQLGGNWVSLIEAVEL